ncbi:MAG: hypothetical protein JWO57_173 [Pseudonocardiales bacterium]|nr:hypothetical protein [Pseudonocardiales bacterium]
MPDEVAVPPLTRKRKHRPPLGYQVLFGMGGVLALAVVTVLFSLIMVVALRHDQNRLEDRDVPYASAVATAALNAKGIANDQRGFLLSGDGTYIREADHRASDVRSAFTQAREAAGGPAQRDAVAQARSGFEDWLQAVNAEFATFRAGHHESAIAASLGPDRELRKSYEQSLTTAQTLGERSIQSASSAATATSSRTLAILVAVMVAAVVLGSGIVYWLMRTIAFPLFRLVSLLGPA